MDCGAVLGLYPDQDQDQVVDLVNDHEHVERFHGPPFSSGSEFSSGARKNRKLKREKLAEKAGVEPTRPCQGIGGL